MKVIEGGFGKPEEEDKERAEGSDVFQAFADMLSDMEEAEEYIKPEVMAVVFWPGTPSLVGSNVEDTNRVAVLTDFLKADMLTLLAEQEAESSGIYDYGDDDDTLH